MQNICKIFERHVYDHETFCGFGNKAQRYLVLLTETYHKTLNKCDLTIFW